MNAVNDPLSNQKHGIPPTLVSVGEGPSPGIVIVGPSCSGKSTVAARLGERFGIKPTEYDRIVWREKWVRTPIPEARNQLLSLLTKREPYIIEGTFRIGLDLLPFARRVIWLDFRLTVILPRILKRSIGRIWNKQDLGNGNKETLKQLLHPRRSLIVKTIRKYQQYQRAVFQHLCVLPHLRIRSSTELALLLATLQIP